MKGKRHSQPKNIDIFQYIENIFDGSFEDEYKRQYAQTHYEFEGKGQRI
jgi:hypothetical protein